MTIDREQIIKIKPWDREKSYVYFAREQLYEQGTFQFSQGTPIKTKPKMIYSFSIYKVMIPWKVMCPNWNHKSQEEYKRKLEEYNKLSIDKQSYHIFDVDNITHGTIYPNHIGSIRIDIEKANDYGPEFITNIQHRDIISKVYKKLLKNRTRYF